MPDTNRITWENNILGFVTKLMLIKRWDSLDKKVGAELFKKLVDEVRETYKKEETEE